MSTSICNSLWLAAPNGRQRKPPSRKVQPSTTQVVNEDTDDKPDNETELSTFGWDEEDQMVQRSCWIIRPPIHPATVVLIIVLILFLLVFGLLGCFLVFLIILFFLYRFYI